MRIDSAEAAAEFQKILDHPGVVFGDPVGARRICNLAEPMLFREIRSRQRLPIKISSPSGKTPTLTSRS